MSNNTILTTYVSEIDQLLQTYDKKHPAQSLSQQKECQKYKRVILMVWIMCFTCDVYAKQKKNKIHNTKPHVASTVKTIFGKQNLIAEINSILYALDNNASIGISIRSMKYGDTLFAKNEYRLFTPASIIKILTAEAALLYLGSEYKFPTTLLTDARNMQNGVINGNVYLVQSGDPSLTYYDLTDLMVTLKAQQVRGIAGSVFIDNTAYDENISGLPIAGRDGTLKNRLHNVATKVRAKTGTMSGVVALAGYAIGKLARKFSRHNFKR